MLENLSIKQLKRLYLNREYAVWYARYFVNYATNANDQNMLKMWTKRRVIIDSQRWKIQDELKNRGISNLYLFLGDR